MGVLLATEYACKELPQLFPFIVSSENEAKRLVSQTIYKTSEEITNFFLDLFGISDISFEFITKFNELLQINENASHDTKQLTRQPITDTKQEAPKVEQKVQTKKQNVVTRRQKKPHPSAGTTTSELLLKRIRNLNQKEDPKKKKTAAKQSKPDNEIRSQEISGLPEELQQFENIPMTEESIAAMSKYFCQLQVDRELKNTKTSSAAKICGCQSLVHGLYTLSPNCLNCGKIICNLEAKQTGGERCIFCGESLLSNSQIESYLNLLNLDKLRLKFSSMQQELKDLIEKKRKMYSEDKKAGNKKIHMNLQGGSLRGGYISKEILNNQVETILAEGKKKNLKVQDLLENDTDIVRMKQQIYELETELEIKSKVSEEDKDLKDAKKRLDTLLNFQNTSEERTKIIDVAGDFDFGVSGDVKSLFEGSAEERALKLNLKQRNLKLLKEQELQRVGKGKSEFVFDIDSNGNVSVEQKDMDLKKNNKATSEIVIDEEDEELLNEINALRDKIYELKLKDFDISSKKIYDPNDSKNRLAQPKYVSMGISAENDAQSKEYMIKAGQRENIGVNMGSLEENIALFI